MIDDLAATVNNWDRWPDDDQLGTLNYITPGKVAAAAALVRSGTVIELGVPLERTGGPQATAPRRYNPIHFMDELPADYRLPGDVGVADDVLVLPLQSSTQWDSLAHVSHRGKLYKGRPDSAVTSHGAQVNSIRQISGKVIGRGVLLDVAREHGVATLPPGHAIGPDDLDRCSAAGQVEVGEGDIVLVRTGYLAHCRERGWAGYHGDAPGMGLAALPWLHDRRVAAIATDTASLEVKPFDDPDVGVPFHAVAIPHMGLLLGEIFDFETLSAECATAGRWAFLFVAPPLPVTAGVGSPANPYAVL